MLCNSKIHSNAINTCSQKYIYLKEIIFARLIFADDEIGLIWRGLIFADRKKGQISRKKLQNPRKLISLR